MEEDGGGRGCETAATQSAADRKIKERDAVGSRHRFVRRERENERTRESDEGKVSEVTRASRVSSFTEIAKFLLPPSLSLSLWRARKTRWKLFARDTPEKYIQLQCCTSVQDYASFITAG